MAQESVVVNVDVPTSTAASTNGADDSSNGGVAAKASAGVVSFISLKPQLVVEAPKAADAVQFYKNAFGAEELKREFHPKRKAEQELPLILCAELKLASSVLQVCDQVDDSAASVTSAGGVGGGGLILCLETDDVDAAVKKAVEAGAVAEGGEIEKIAAADDGEIGCCGGARVGKKVKDPFGYVWCFCSSSSSSVVQNKVIDVEA